VAPAPANSQAWWVACSCCLVQAAAERGVGSVNEVTRMMQDRVQARPLSASVLWADDVQHADSDGLNDRGRRRPGYPARRGTGVGRSRAPGRERRSCCGRTAWSGWLCWCWGNGLGSGQRPAGRCQLVAVACGCGRRRAWSGAAAGAQRSGGS